jgi:hypothetical protein
MSENAFYFFSLSISIIFPKPSVSFRATLSQALYLFNGKTRTGPKLCSIKVEQENPTLHILIKFKQVGMYDTGTGQTGEKGDPPSDPEI